MTAIATSPFPIYLDVDGSALENGYLYFGVAGQNPETNPITVYWDSTFETPAAQPIRTSGGYAVRNGSPAMVYFSAIDYSITVRDKNRRLVYSKLSTDNAAAQQLELPVADVFTGNGATTVYTLSKTPSGQASLHVSIGGVTQTPGVDYTLTNGSKILTFTSAPPSGTTIVVLYGQSSEALSQISYTVQASIATAGQTVFNLTNQYTPGANTLAVYLNGLRLTVVSDYAETSTSSITLTAGAVAGDELLFVTGTTEINPVSITASAVAYTPAGTGAVARDVQSKLRESVSVLDFGAVGDGIADDTAEMQAALDAATAAGGGVVYGVPGKNYRITSGLTINANNVVLDLNGSRLTADFSTGTAITVGSTSVLSGLGVRNGLIITTNPSTALNGVVFKKNVRRQVQYGGLRINGFKGVGLTFEELNWSIQEQDAPLIESCGINLDVHDNGNAITISGAGLDGATTYNVRLRGTFGVTFIGGYNQFAGSGGVLMDTATIGALQNCFGTSFYGVYFEGNGVSHIVGNNGRGLTINGCYMSCNLMSGVAIDLNAWTGANIVGNVPVSTSGRDFVNADASSSLICVGRQAVSSVSDVTIGGSPNAYVSEAFPVPVATLPTAGILNRGTQLLLSGAGTGANRETLHICSTVASGTRAFRRVAFQARKQTAQAGSTPYTPNLGSFECFDLTVPAAGMTINAPTGPYDDGDEIIFLFRQASSPTGGITWDSVYKTDLSTTLLANGYGSVTFRWSAGRSFWVQTAKLEWKA